MPGDLGRAAAGAGGDHQFLPGGPAPHPGPGVAGRGGVADRPEPDRLVVADQPLLAQRQRIRLVRQRVQHLPLGGQPVRRDRGGLPVHPAVDPAAELPAGLLQLGEAAVGRQQVRLRRHQVRLGDLHRRLDPALGLGIERHARLHLAAVMPPERDHLRVPHRDPGHVVHGDGPRVVGQQVGRRAAHGAQRLVDAPGQRARAAGPRPGSPPGTATRPATPRTAASSARRSAARRPSPTAATSPARGPTAGSACAGLPARPPSPPRPPAESTAPTPGSPSRRACGAPRPPGSSPCSGQPAPRPSA